MQIVKIKQFNRVVSTQTMRVPKTRSNNPNEQTFYLSSETRPGEEYIIRTRASHRYFDSWGKAEVEYICTCPDFTVRRWANHEDCKHIQVVKAFASRVGSASALADLVREEQA